MQNKINNHVSFHEYAKVCAFSQVAAVRKLSLFCYRTESHKKKI